MDSIKNGISDRIYRIIQIDGPSTKGYLAAGEKNPVNLVQKMKLNIESIQQSKGIIKIQHGIHTLRISA